MSDANCNILCYETATVEDAIWGSGNNSTIAEYMHALDCLKQGLQLRLTTCKGPAPFKVEVVCLWLAVE